MQQFHSWLYTQNTVEEADDGVVCGERKDQEAKKKKKGRGVLGSFREWVSLFESPYVRVNYL